MIQLVEELINVMASLLVIIKNQNEIIEQNKLAGSLSEQDKNTVLKAISIKEQQDFYLSEKR